MKNHHRSIGCVLNRFPEHRPSLERLWQIDASFQSLCDEYEDCTMALEYWRESASTEAPIFREEYAVLIKQLEEEVISYLQDFITVHEVQ
jgi:hypothetical protein